MRRLSSILFCLYAGALCAGVGNVYNVDKREYVNWSDYPFNLTLKVLRPGRPDRTFCTAQYVARDLILTAEHCAKEKIMSFKNSDGRVFSARLAASGYFENDTDWALYRALDAAGILGPGASPLGVLPRTAIRGGVQIAGFGDLRKLSDQEIEDIRWIIIYLLQTQRKFSLNAAEKQASSTSMNGMWESIDSEVARRGMAPIWGDSERLKLSAGCGAVKFDNYKLVAHNCDSVGGNSGAALLVREQDGFKVLGVESSGLETVGKNDLQSGFAVRTEIFYNQYLGAKRSSPPDDADDADPPQSAPASTPAQRSRDKYCIDCALIGWVGLDACNPDYREIFINDGRLYRLLAGDNAVWAFENNLMPYAVRNGLCEDFPPDQLCVDYDAARAKNIFFTSSARMFSKNGKRYAMVFYGSARTLGRTNPELVVSRNFCR